MNTQYGWIKPSPLSFPKPINPFSKGKQDVCFSFSEHRDVLSKAVRKKGIYLLGLESDSVTSLLLTSLLVREVRRNPPLIAVRLNYLTNVF